MPELFDTLLLIWQLAAAGLIFHALRRVARGQAWVVERPQPQSRLGILDAAIAHFAMTLITVLALSALQGPDRSDPARLELSLGLAQSLAITVIVLIVARRHGLRYWRKAFSLEPTGAWRLDLGFGLLLAIALIPPLLKFHQLISTIAEVAFDLPYRHDTLEKLKRDDVSPLESAALWYRTVLVTPVLEEILYRGLLLGALLGIASRRPFDPLLALFGLPKSTQEPPIAPITPFWPVPVSAAVFAAAHWGQGAGPLSLFVLSLILGETVRKSGSLVPAILAHLALNAWTLANVMWSSTSA